MQLTTPSDFFSPQDATPATRKQHLRPLSTRFNAAISAMPSPPAKLRFPSPRKEERLSAEVVANHLDSELSVCPRTEPTRAAGRTSD